MTNTITNKRGQPGKTLAQSSESNQDQPKLPHEQDESDDSQASGPREVIQQAYDDVQSGQEDTDLRASCGKRVGTVPKNKQSKT